jgi:sugar phosphate isomerase/epimerase
VLHNVVGDLASLDPALKAKALETFNRGAKIARELGNDTLNMVAQWPRGLKGPTAYPPHAIYTTMRGMDKFSPKLQLELPKGFDWNAIWANYVDSIRTCVGIARDHGLRFALEGHTHVIVSHTDAFLRLFDHVPDPALGANFDTGWQFMQREYLPMSVHKLGERIFHVHAKDSDGLLNYSLPPGLGIVDWDGLVDALHAVGFDGFMSFELGRYAEPKRWLKHGLDYLEGVIAAHGYG